MCYSFISVYANLPNSSCHFSKQKWVFLQILHQSSVPSNIIPLHFFKAQTLYTLVKRANERANFLDFRVFESKFVKFLMSIFKWQINSSSNFASFFVVTRHNSFANFKLIHFLLWTKESNQSPNFDTFKCSGENLPNFSCHFPNHKSVFLQILHHSSVSWKITPLYCFSSNIIYFGHKEPIKMQIF